MFSRNIWCVTEVTQTCKRALFQKSSAIGYGRTQIRKSFHNSRRGGRSLEPDPIEHMPFDSGPVHVKDLLKPLFFTVGVTTVSLGGCIIWEYENLRAHAAHLLRRPGQLFHTHIKKYTTHHKSEPGLIKKWWNGLRESEKVFYPILAANILVFGAWRIKALQPIMVKYFCSNPASGSKCWPMILSTFSHYSPLHLAANMYVLYSFMPAAITSMGKEQFLATYFSAGVVSSFASFFYKVVTSQPGLSLGASGAIMAVLSYVCIQYPDTQLSIIFLPMYTFAAGSAIKVIMGVDLAGVLLGWKFFDHAAHLGGALFGLAWCYWGGNHVWGNRDKFLQYYHTLRKTDSPGR